MRETWSTVYFSNRAILEQWSNVTTQTSVFFSVSSINREKLSSVHISTKSPHLIVTPLLSLTRSGIASGFVWLAATAMHCVLVRYRFGTVVQLEPDRVLDLQTMVRLFGPQQNSVPLQTKLTVNGYEQGRCERPFCQLLCTV